MDRYEQGLSVRREVLGDEHVDRAIAGTTALDTAFQHWITEAVWCDLWADEGLDRRTRSLVTIAILAALGRDELDAHLRGSRNTGVTDDDLGQVLRHVAVYAGVPAANAAFDRAKRLPASGSGD
jgi:4-carboxymuconolactone decarboxylase